MMLRKPSLPPVGYMRIEGMSDGREVIADPGLDDFTGQPIAVAKPSRPTLAKPLQSGQELRDRASRAKVAQGRDMLERVGLLPRSDARRGLEQGSSATLALPKPAWGQAIVMVQGQAWVVSCGSVPIWRRV